MITPYPSIDTLLGIDTRSFDALSAWAQEVQRQIADEEKSQHTHNNTSHHK